MGTSKQTPAAKQPTASKSTLSAPGVQGNDDHAVEHLQTSAQRRRVVDVDDPIVTAKVERRFMLQYEPGRVAVYEAGIQKMPRSHLEHPYSKMHGAVEFKA